MMNRWGIVGYGWVARDYMVPAILALGGRIVAIADPDVKHGVSVDSETSYYIDIDGLLAGSSCDMIYVATPNYAHAGPVCLIAKHKIPVLCEKPLAATLGDAEAMADGIAHSGTLYGTAFDQRHHPAHKAIHAALHDGLIGTPIAIRVVYACWLDAQWSPGIEPLKDNWRINPATAGGGAVIDLAPHGLDLAQFLLGEPLKHLNVMLQHRIHAYGVDDGGMLTAEMSNGVLLSLHVAYNCRHTLPRRRLEVLGDKGMIVAIDTMGQNAGGTVEHICGLTGEVKPIAFDETLSPFAAQVAAFQAAASGEPHDFSMSRDIGTARMLDAAYRKALTCL